MKKNILLSIIVPIYNKEQWIENQINSILNQNFDNYELILVDDGSSDRSGIICDNYASNKKVTVIHQKNGGVCSARNNGFKYANGKYVGFMDADDEIKPNMYKDLIEFSEREKLDVAICGTEIRLGHKTTIKNGKGKTYIVNRENAIEQFLVGGFFTYGACNKIYRKSIIDRIKFDENFKINEDKYFMYQALCSSNKIGVLGEPLFINHKRINSASTSHFNPSFFDIVKVSNLICADVKTNFESLYIKSRYLSLMELVRRMCREGVYYKYSNEVEYINTIVLNNEYYSSIKSMLSLKYRVERVLYNKFNKVYVFLIFLLYKIR